uniref:Uncharacterized protein n=1 Tax=Avena sativa TaxID=4498 RepID=A0ACD6A5M7_AVESA
MAAPFLLVGLLLIASGATAGVEDGARELPHLQLPGTPDSGRAHGSDALLDLPCTPDLGCAHGSDAPPPPSQGFIMDILSGSGCGRFADLVAATPNASNIFDEERIAAGGGGLTVFCPDDKAVAAFEPTLRALADDDRLDVLLHHASAARYGRAQLQAFDWVAVRTLAANNTQSITVRDDGDTVWLWTSCQRGAVRVIKMAVSSEEAPLAVYLVDAVLLPGHVRQKLGGGDEAAARGGSYLAWLHCCVPLWAALSWVLAVIVGYLIGGWLASSRFQDPLKH